MSDDLKAETPERNYVPRRPAELMPHLDNTSSTGFNLFLNSSRLIKANFSKIVVPKPDEPEPNT